MSIKAIATGFISSLVLVVGMPLTALAASNVLVTPNNTQGWSTADTRPGGSVNFMADSTAPGTPNNGALQLTTNNTTTSKAQYLHAANTALSDVSKLSYYTKQVAPAGLTADPSYQLATYLNGGTSGFTTLVYEPYQGGQGAVTNNTWQNWNIDSTGLFWSTRTVTCSNGTITGSSGGPAIYTLAQVKTACPSAVVIGYGVNIGSNNPGYNIETDLFNFNGTTYNFEPTVGPPTHKSQCRDGGYKTFNSPRTFPNQDACIDYVNNHDHEIHGNVKYTAYGLDRHAILQMNTANNRGIFKYSDVNGDHYRVKVSDVNVSGKDAYFSGVVSDASNRSWNGLWLFGKVHDNTPDQISGSFTDQTTAENGVASMSSPADGPFTVTQGKLEITQ